MLTNEQKIAMLKRAKHFPAADKWKAVRLINALDSAPADTDIRALYRAESLDSAVQLMRDKWMTGLSIRCIEALTGFHKQTIYREIDRRKLSRSSALSSPIK
ncbi:hypothetical protein [Bacillus mycoides]|uniref:hypothetical protein n=1 Tax=Bacillus mycoides TaxID=1405 RepID=UPI0024ADE910|nr:hypothetical protein [Bacillus mycoides]MDI6535159.1 hypothetical protein [Bacillus mycoides]